jgi:hypothetical protein
MIWRYVDCRSVRKELRGEELQYYCDEDGDDS